jgi:transcriptional regulator with XRE-family HTH domain
MNDIIENIKHIRKQKQLTQKDVAEKLGITPAGYQKIEVGSIELTYNKLKQIAGIFQMSVVEIIEYPNVVGAGADSERVKELEREIIDLKRLYVYERMRANRIMVNQAQDDLITAQNENLELETIQDLKDRIVFYKREVEKDEKDLKNLGLNMFTINVAADSPPTR